MNIKLWIDVYSIHATTTYVVPTYYMVHMTIKHYRLDRAHEIDVSSLGDLSHDAARPPWLMMGFHPKSRILTHMKDFLRSSYVCLDSLLDITRTTKSR